MGTSVQAIPNALQAIATTLFVEETTTTTYSLFGPTTLSLSVHFLLSSLSVYAAAEEGDIINIC